ncbi:MAG TPA: hypothetical protein VN733_01760 [Solirubrobacterales bacterium]|nr:hypothetical protein [Solirubrobacterales bacterium]
MKQRTGWRKHLPESLWPVIVGPLIVGLVLAGVTGAAKGLFVDDPAPDLLGLDPVVHNGPAEYEGWLNSEGFRVSQQTSDSGTRVELRLKNEGERRAYITAATFTISRLIRVPPCGAGGGVMLSGHYAVVLPRDAAEGETIEAPIDRQILPDGVDRFEFRVGRDRDGMDVGLTYVYQLDVALRHDGASEPVDVGRILVALPGVPSIAATGLNRPPSEQQGCIEDTVKSLQEAAELDGTRSPALERLLAEAH